LDESYDALLQIGLHAHAVTPGALMAHGRWTLNDRPIGEIGMNAAIAGAHGVPCVFVSGDRAAADEARTLIPEIRTGVVKEALHNREAGLTPAPGLSLSPVRAREVIRNGVREALAEVDQIRPFETPAPVRLLWHFGKPEQARGFAAEVRSARLVDGVTVELTGDNLLDILP
jgi:D-amino peptidase